MCCGGNRLSYQTSLPKPTCELPAKSGFEQVRQPYYRLLRWLEGLRCPPSL